MKYSITALTAAAVLPQAIAFPRMDTPEVQSYLKRAAAAQNPSISGNDVVDPAHALNIFDAKKQYIDTTGEHAWKAPGPNDQRGVCPGLNALANHGYLPHDGVATNQQLIEATNKVYGMGLDLSVFLAIIGDVFDGNLKGWSIGGPSPKIPGGNGLTGSHNKYENDVSPTRGDLYQYGNNHDIVWKQWQQFYDMQKGVSDAESNYNLKVLQEFRSSRWDQSVSENSYFFQGPFSGVLVQPAAYTFIYRFMANKSAEHPEGQLTKSVLKDFFGVTENDDGSFSGGAGYERIPDNWYRRAFGAEYTIPFFLLDVVQEASVYPKFLDIGGNTGAPNTFNTLDLRDPAGGVLNLARLLEGNNLWCFAFQSFQNAAPDQVLSLGKLVGSLFGSAGSQLADFIESAGCSKLYNIQQKDLEKYPGFTKSQGK